MSRGNLAVIALLFIVAAGLIGYQLGRGSQPEVAPPSDHAAAAPFAEPTPQVTPSTSEVAAPARPDELEAQSVPPPRPVVSPPTEATSPAPIPVPAQPVARVEERNPAEAPGAHRLTPRPATHGPPAPAPAAAAREAGDPSPTQQDELRERIQSSFRDSREDFAECYEMLRELEPVDFTRLVFELQVTRDPHDAEHGIVELTAVEADDLVLDNVACFAEIVEHLEMPPPAGSDDTLTIRYPVTLNSD